MSQAPGRAASAVRLFDAHCHLQDPRIAGAAPSLIRAATASGVSRFAVNGTSEVSPGPAPASVRERQQPFLADSLSTGCAQKDWHLVKQMAQEHPAVVPCFGLHPWQDFLPASCSVPLPMLSGF
jgi:TatD DNase family protein